MSTLKTVKVSLFDSLLWGFKNVILLGSQVSQVPFQPQNPGCRLRGCKEVAIILLSVVYASGLETPSSVSMQMVYVKRPRLFSQGVYSLEE